MDRLHQRNIKVFLISGGFRCIVEHVATQLSIPLHHVYANRLKFYFNGTSKRQRVWDFSVFIRGELCLFLHLYTLLSLFQGIIAHFEIKLYVCFPGEYAGFDESQPTAESGGKGKVISMLKEQYGFKTVVMIGDGATDLEACPPAVSVIVSYAASNCQYHVHTCMFERWLISILENTVKHSVVTVLSLFFPSECFHWIWWQCHQAAG